MKNYPTLVPQPKAGDQYCFLYCDSEQDSIYWKEPNKLDSGFYLSSDKYWIPANEESFFLKGNKKWRQIDLSEVPKPLVTYVYLYDNTRLHFSNTPIENHEDHVLTKSAIIDDSIRYTNYTLVPWYANRNVITEITSEPGFQPPQYMDYWFAYLSNITNVDALSDWNFAGVTSMISTFGYCTKLSNIDGLKNAKVSRVTDMSSMFYNNSSLVNVDALSEWNTSRIISMASMFEYCTALENLDGLLKWDTSCVINMGSMLYHCESLKNVDGCIRWDTDAVRNMDYLADNCISLENIDGMKFWDTSAVIYLGSAFKNCKNIQTFEPLNNWDISKVKYYSNIFTDTIGVRPAWGQEW